MPTTREHMYRTYGRVLQEVLEQFRADFARMPNGHSSPFVTADRAWAIENTPEGPMRNARLLLGRKIANQGAFRIANIADHLDAMSRLMQPPRGWLYSPHSLARVMAEAAAMLTYLLSSNLKSETRLLRGAVVYRNSVWWQLNAAREVSHSSGTEDFVRSAHEEDEASQRLLTEAGLVRHKKNAWMWDGDDPNNAERVPDESDLIRHAFDPAMYPGIYQHGSGVVHSQGWALGPVVHDHDADTLIFRDDPGIVGNAVSVAIASTAQAVRIFGGYTGRSVRDCEQPYLAWETQIIKTANRRYRNNPRPAPMV